MEERCDASTGVLNCGCCDEVMLACSLAPGHDGDHEDSIWEKENGGRRRTRDSRIRWAYVEEGDWRG